MIKIKDLTKNFGKTNVLDSISFSIADHSIFGLVGSNGAGKSTLLRTIAGIYRPDSGTVEIEEEPVFENSSIKRGEFFIPDDPYFVPHASMDDMANFYARFYPLWDQDEYERLCSLFPIERKTRITQFSKGMRRQVSLILALSARPKYLLMDEVFDGLDPVMRQLLKKLVSAEVAQRDMTVVIASHNLRELEDFCDHVGLLHHGNILFESDLDSLRLGICKVQAVIEPVPSKETLHGLNIIKMNMRGTMLEFVVRASKEEILEKLEPFHPVFLEVSPSTLEEIFICEMEAAGYDLENFLK